MIDTDITFSVRVPTWDSATATEVIRAPSIQL